MNRLIIKCTVTAGKIHNVSAIVTARRFILSAEEFGVLSTQLVVRLSTKLSCDLWVHATKVAAKNFFNY